MMGTRLRIKQLERMASMKICNVIEIFDNGEFITVTTSTGSNVHLPSGMHSITIHGQDISIDMHEGGYTPEG